jgi:hypothetical protein
LRVPEEREDDFLAPPDLRDEDFFDEDFFAEDFFFDDDFFAVDFFFDDDFFAVDFFFEDDLRAVDFLAVDFFAVDFLAVDFFAVERFAVERFAVERLRDGTLAPFSRASESAIAIACLRLVTVPPCPALPRFNVPRLRRCIALFTDLLAAFPYLRPPLDRFVAAMSPP